MPLKDTCSYKYRGLKAKSPNTDVKRIRYVRLDKTRYPVKVEKTYLYLHPYHDTTYVKLEDRTTRAYRKRRWPRGAIKHYKKSWIVFKWVEHHAKPVMEFLGLWMTAFLGPTEKFLDIVDPPKGAAEHAA